MGKNLAIIPKMLNFKDFFFQFTHCLKKKNKKTNTFVPSLSLKYFVFQITV